MSIFMPLYYSRPNLISNFLVMIAKNNVQRRTKVQNSVKFVFFLNNPSVKTPVSIEIAVRKAR